MNTSTIMDNILSDFDIAPETVTALNLAEELTCRGITVFSMKRNSAYREGSDLPEFVFPLWKSLTSSSALYNEYRSGDGLAMRCGRIAGIDLDFTDANAVNEEVQRIINLGVVVIAWVLTPRGGAHIWTLGHGHAKGSVKTHHGRIDYQGDGALLYIVGSSRPKYGNENAYSFIDAPNWQLLDAASEADIERNGEAVNTYLDSIGMTSTAVLTKAGGNVVIPADLPAMPAWLKAEIADLSEEAVGDRSARFHHLVAACQRARLDEGQAVAALTPWCEATGKYEGRVEQEVRRCWEKIVVEKITDETETLPEGMFTLVGSDDSSLLPVEGKMTEDEFWESRDYLSYIRQRAYSKTEAPYALLLSTLVRISGELNPNIVLPDVVASEVSLNYFGVLLDTSGGGKSTNVALSRNLRPWETEECGISSGEGLVTSYMHKTKDEDGNHVSELKTDALLIMVDESEALLAIDSRHGNTAMSHLRTLWTAGGGIGINNKSTAEKMQLPPHSVRTAVLIGGQPVALGRILVDEGKGTAERFVVMRLSDPSIPLEQPPVPHGGLPMRLEKINKIRERKALIYDPRIREFIVRTQHSEKTGLSLQTNVISPTKFGKVTGHRNLIIAKTAGLLAVWDGRLNVTLQDWGLAIHFLSVAADSRAWGLERLAEAVASDNRAAGVAAAHREIATEQTKDKVLLGQTLESIMDKIRDNGGEISVSALNKKLSKRQRGLSSDAIKSAVGVGKLVIETRKSLSGREESVEWLKLGENG